MLNIKHKVQNTNVNDYRLPSTIKRIVQTLKWNDDLIYLIN